MPFPKHARTPSTIQALLFAAVLLAPSMGAQAQQTPTDDRSIDEVVETALRQATAPGAVLAIVLRDSIAFLQAYGHTSFDETAVPLTPDALFRASALSELLNALAAARLAQQGRLRMHAALGTLIPELPRELRAVTTAQLLTHTAGLAQQVAVPGRGGANDLGAAARGLTHLDRVAPPGALYSYSPPGMALVGLAIERAAGRPYAAAMRRTVLDPIGMLSSTFDFETAQPALIPGWQRSNSRESPTEQVSFVRDSATRVPVRGLYTTAADAARLAIVLLNDGMIDGVRVLPEGVAASVLEPRADIPFSSSRVGRGVRINLRQGRRAVSMSGGSGHSVSMTLLPAERLGVIVLVNRTGDGLASIADFVIRRLFGDYPATARPEPAPADSATLGLLAARAGRYLNGAELIEIIAQDGKPQLKSGNVIMEIRALPGEAFGAMIQGRVALRFQLITDASGRSYIWLGNRALGSEQPR